MKITPFFFFFFLLLLLLSVCSTVQSKLSTKSLSNNQHLSASSSTYQSMKFPPPQSHSSFSDFEASKHEVPRGPNPDSN
ncbi:hypothetical protein IEQ34_010294 [Dendrobium chrysotoxum]|uniref:Uncharacterized protein n=1 Tax=Dendrobium chrysotoxum TaxID=161865 RepID=A0AAV7GLR8_DENCH|nr:hypothetical protein IEQ34_010294 [Dendrobium chrysotoxum]